GALFTVELPIPQTQLNALDRHNPGEPISPQALQGKVVLVVDDEDDARDYITYVLKQCGADVVSASSADEAFKKLQGANFDAIVSDIGMPGEDGFQLMRRIRRQGMKIPAVAVTAFARGEDTVRTLDAGFSKHLPKPVNPNELCSAVAEVVK